MFEQFEKMWEEACKNHIGNSNAMEIAQKVWRKCCLWALQKANENIRPIEVMQELANEAGVNVVVVGNKLKFEGGIIKDPRSMLQRRMLQISYNTAPFPSEIFSKNSDPIDDDYYQSGIDISDSDDEIK